MNEYWSQMEEIQFLAATAATNAAPLPLPSSDNINLN